MKSEKARELIEKYAVGDSREAAPTLLKRTAILCVELAEQEAEERMWKKAIQAYCDGCVENLFGKCSIGVSYCKMVQGFIYKLTEE